MSALEHFQAGQLSEAIAVQNELVRKHPADVDARFQLFTFLCFAGDLERAEKQLDVLGNTDQKLQLGSVVYRHLLASELERRRVYEQGARPVLPPDHPEYVKQRLEALAQLRAGNDAEAARQVSLAIEGTQALAGRIDGTPFDGLCDYDDVLGSVLEVFAGGRYLWLPFHHVRSVEISEPRSALDTLWLPARLLDASGESAQVHIPATYAGSHAHPDEAIRLGRDTDWEQRGELHLGKGLRMFLCAAGDATQEYAATHLRSLEFDGGSGTP